MFKGIVPKSYLMNPSTEELLPHGSLLQDGMVVLRENIDCKADTGKFLEGDSAIDQTELARAYKWNRWVKVLAPYCNGAFVNFIGEFDDGSRMMLAVGLDQGWFSKLVVENWEDMP